MSSAAFRAGGVSLRARYGFRVLRGEVESWLELIFILILEGTIERKLYGAGARMARISCGGVECQLAIGILERMWASGVSGKAPGRRENCWR